MSVSVCLVHECERERLRRWSEEETEPRQRRTKERREQRESRPESGLGGGGDDVGQDRFVWKPV